MSSEPTITEQLRALLPEPNDELSAALEKVARLEHEYTATVEQARIEREFLERAPREGLLYPGDALKLENLTETLREPGTELSEVFRGLREQRPYLFAPPAGSPANQKLSAPDPKQILESLRHGSLTRQVQAIRRRRR